MSTSIGVGTVVIAHELSAQALNVHVYFNLCFFNFYYANIFSSDDSSAVDLSS